MSPGAHRTRGGGEARQSRRGQQKRRRQRTDRSKRMRSNSKRYRSKVVQLGSFNSVHAYRVYFSPTDRDGILIFACPQESTEPEEAETRDRAQEDIKKAEAAKRQKQAHEEQEQKVTFQERTRSSAVTLSRFCAYVSCSFLSNLRRSDFDFCMSPGAHRTRGGGQKEGGGGKASKASG